MLLDVDVSAWILYRREPSFDGFRCLDYHKSFSEMLLGVKYDVVRADLFLKASGMCIEILEDKYCAFRLSSLNRIESETCPVELWSSSRPLGKLLLKMMCLCC